jgi:hypothetical protein
MADVIAEAAQLVSWLSRASSHIIQGQEFNISRAFRTATDPAAGNLDLDQHRAQIAQSANARV